PNLVKEFAEGMLSQIGLVGNAAEAIMQQAQKGLTGGQSGGVPSAAYATGITAAGGSNISMARVEALLEQLVSQSSRTPSLGASPAPATAGSVLQQFGNVNLNLPGMDVLSLTSYQNMLAGLAYEYAQRGAINGAAW
ncbi:MAG TPA: hypothetical protein VFU69_17440, partial [Ktedonobacterales bacterium]|nr:hypothetical protein [Ktedonobacterales bacterium]